MKRYIFLCHVCGNRTEHNSLQGLYCDHCGYGKAEPPPLIAVSVVEDAICEDIEAYRQLGNETAAEALEAFGDRLMGWCRPTDALPWKGGDNHESDH